MVYESFDGTKNKLEKIWNKTETNLNELKNIPVTKIDFKSINFSKKIITIPILSNYLLPTASLNEIQSVLLEGFPEWMINMIEPVLTYRIEDGYVSFIIDDSFFEAFQKGILKSGDVSIVAQSFKYLINKIDKNYLFKFFYGINIREAIVSQVGFGSIAIPVYINLTLKIKNNRIYENTNQIFE